MEDLISRRAVNTLVDELARAISDERCFLSRGRSTGEIMSDILNLPSAENKGEWIYQQGIVPYKWRCNKCERMFKTDFNYCPNCGADMGGET